MLYKVTDKQLLENRNDIFKNVGLPSLERNGFFRRPFKTSWNGEYNNSIKGYSYEMARIIDNTILEIINTHILKGEPWIQISLNIFEISPKIDTISLLYNKDGISFGMPNNSVKSMRLRSDDYKGPPIFYMMFLPEHKIGSFYTEKGYKDELNKLKSLIKKDMENIDKFVKRWREIHKPNLVDWEGNIIKIR